MLKRDEIADPNSAWNRAADDEPLFIVRGTDPLAPKLIEDWSARSVIDALHEDAKIKAAFRFAQYVRQWFRLKFPKGK